MDEAILEATKEVLRHRGWSGTTIEEVAARSGSAKTSIYRRYPSKIALVAAAATRDRELIFPVFDTGSAWGDLTSFVLGSLRMLGSLWHLVLPGILAEAAEDPEIRNTVKEYWGWRRRAVTGIVERGIERGEIRAGTDAELVLDSVDGPLLFRLMVTGAPFAMHLAHELVETVMRAFGPGTGHPPIGELGQGTRADEDRLEFVGVDEHVFRVSATREDRPAEAWKDGGWAPLPISSGEARELGARVLTAHELAALGIATE